MQPTPINIHFVGNLPAKRAEIGAATTPPTIKPAITCQCETPIVAKKVKALAKVTKNSVKLTVPITNWGERPFDINVEVTKGPQPPPPKESKKPPAKANQPARLTFFF